MSPIPIKKIPIDLTKDTPSKVTAEELKGELNAIGLRCKETRIEKLEKYIEETVSTFADGNTQGFGIFKYNSPEVAEFYEKGYTVKSISELAPLTETIHSNWKPTDTAPYMTDLVAVANPKHFDYLLANYTGFAGKKSSEQYTKNNTTVDAIKEQFTKIALNISSTLVNDLDKDQMEAVFNKTIAPVDPSNENYDSGTQNRNILLVKGYNESKKECDAIGVINVEYRLQISDYKEKKDKHKTYTLDVTVRTSLYTDTSKLEAEVTYLQNIFKNTMFFDSAIPFNPEVKIYDALPPEIKDTFIHSLPLEQTKNNIISCMVLYAPDLENIGCIDNRNSEGQAQYSKTITSGFTFTFGQKISAGLKYSAGTLLTKAEFSASIEISFTEQWNKSQSETITFSVPKNAVAYLYQGYLQCAVLEFNTDTFKYSYKETGRFLSNIIKTTPKPIDTKPITMMNTGRIYAEDKPDELPLWESL